MPKMKSHSGARKRIKKLKSGLFKAAHSGRRHMLMKKNQKCKRCLRKALYINACDLNHIKQLLPY